MPGGELQPQQDVQGAPDVGVQPRAAPAKSHHRDGVRRRHLEDVGHTLRGSHHERRRAQGLGRGRGLPPGGYPPRVGVGRLHREGLGFRPEAVHDNLRRAHAGCVERGFPRVRGLHRVVLAGSQRPAVGPDVRQVQAGVPRARGQRQRGVLAAGDEQLRHRLLGQDGFPLGHAHGAVRADAVRTLEQREPPELQHRRRRHRVVRRRRHGEALGRSHGCGDFVGGLRPAPRE